MAFRIFAGVVALVLLGGYLIAPVLKNRINVSKALESLPPVTCHAGHVNQVFMNILTNAAQAIRGDGWIDIQARTLTLEGGIEGVEVRVKDSGPGIPAEHLNKIFDPFFTTKERGTGFGLSVVLRIVKNYGGRIQVESGPGVGSRFLVTLPLG